jgi:hypothetical protein
MTALVTIYYLLNLNLVNLVNHFFPILSVSALKIATAIYNIGITAAAYFGSAVLCIVLLSTIKNQIA